MNFLHIHLAINHSPLYATLFAFFFILIGMMIRNPSIVTAGLVITIVAALCGVAAYYTGDQAADIIKDGPPIAGVEKTVIGPHEQAAVFVLVSSGVAAGFALITLFVGRRRPARPRWMEVVMVIVLLWSLSVVVRVALLGGRIHHPEVRALITR
ncbi:MAG TPA: hypothetical protein VER58_17570 [Thermoanaerobaculia bacterium]|nr:hypothetical protein [Thermoanaerobaculia bacterium]